ncbi:clathrin associated protein complex medium subunit [Podospora pseudopauciseta]|uniref:Clathrin associated protein complex medium subunit n=1 Tax=Podospora pseudopauciseta TaxID=2093780 RepID=A0ABR0HLX3_9PEZI|nr:clathrin associated protein complex medium subunit [Podospora pseudopauciseta]
MLSGILIFNQKGENLIFRAFRNDCRPRLADVFRIQVISNAQVRSPILTLGSTTFSHVKHENIYLVAITKSNANAALVFEFLYRLIQLGRGYFAKFDEAVRTTSSWFMSSWMKLSTLAIPKTPRPTRSRCTSPLRASGRTRAVEDSAKITMQATGALSWRKADVKYRKNEAFVDVIEDVNLLMSATGSVLRADVTGQIIMRAYLSGTPECKFGLNDRLLLDNDGMQTLPSGNRQGSKATKAAAGSVTLEDCQFHQCVKLGKFDSDRIISFVPPDGEFELMRYRATENVNLPFKVHAIVNEVGKTKVEYSIGVRANFGSKLLPQRYCPHPDPAQYG